MARTSVLILGSNSNKELEDLFFDLGLNWILRETMSAALSALRRESFATVVVDRDRVEVDVLEFILNVRDIDRRTPVIILGRGDRPHDEYDYVAFARADPLFLTTCRDCGELERQIGKMMAATDGEANR